MHIASESTTYSEVLSLTLDNGAAGKPDTCRLRSYGRPITDTINQMLAQQDLNIVTADPDVGAPTL